MSTAKKAGKPAKKTSARKKKAGPAYPELQMPVSLVGGYLSVPDIQLAMPAMIVLYFDASLAGATFNVLRGGSPGFAFSGSGPQTGEFGKPATVQAGKQVQVMDNCITRNTPWPFRLAATYKGKAYTTPTGAPTLASARTPTPPIIINK
ncbi:MAG: hypothetical protein JSS41_09210 [Proteobacteria bacterium]|nr:hypothetical protein [Pseudomonadota bacterium]